MMKQERRKGGDVTTTASTSSILAAAAVAVVAVVVVLGLAASTVSAEPSSSSATPQIRVVNGSIVLEPLAEEGGDVLARFGEGASVSLKGLRLDVDSITDYVDTLVEERVDAFAQTILSRVPADLVGRLQALEETDAAKAVELLELRATTEEQRDVIGSLRSKVAVLEREVRRNQELVDAMAATIRRWISVKGFATGFTEIDTMVESEEERQAWIQSDPSLTTTDCLECRSPPFYLHGHNGDRDSYEFMLKTYRSFANFRFPERFPIDGYVALEEQGLLQGRALFISGNQLRAESDTMPHCGAGNENQYCTGLAISKAAVYLANIHAAAPSRIFAPATSLMRAVTPNNAYDLLANFTAEAWIKPLFPQHYEMSTYEPIFAKNAAVGYNQDTFAMYVINSRTRVDTVGFHFKIERASDDRDFGVSTPAIFPRNHWYHVVGVYHGTDLIIYVNGEEMGRVTIGVITAYSGPEDLVIGSNEHTNHGSKGSSNSILDEIRVWKRVLTPQHIQDTVFTPITAPQDDSDLILYLNFEEGDPASIFNATSETYEFTDISVTGAHVFSQFYKRVRSRNGEGYAAMFFDDPEQVTFYPLAEEGRYVGFVPSEDIRCEIEAGCRCPGANLTRVRVDAQQQALVRLPVGTYSICYALQGMDHTMAEGYLLQPEATVSSVAIDPCTNIDCGPEHSCVEGHCQCNFGWSGDLCEIPPSIVGDGSSAQSPLPSCAAAAEVDVSLPAHLFVENENLEHDAVRTLCTVNPAEDDDAIYRAVLSVGNVSEVHNLFRWNDITAFDSATSFSAPASSNSFSSVFVGCVDADGSVKDGTLTDVTSSPMFFIASGAWPAVANVAESRGVRVELAVSPVHSLSVQNLSSGMDYFLSVQMGRCAGEDVTPDNRFAILVAETWSE